LVNTLVVKVTKPTYAPIRSPADRVGQGAGDDPVDAVQAAVQDRNGA
jgi:hypothetical protein